MLINLRAYLNHKSFDQSMECRIKVSVGCRASEECREIFDGAGTCFLVQIHTECSQTLLLLFILVSAAEGECQVSLNHNELLFFFLGDD